MTLVQPFRDSKLQLDDENREAFWQGRRVQLPTPASFSILKLLSSAPDKVHSLSDVLEVAKISEEAEEGFVQREIALIKKAFTDVDMNGAPITVIPRRGYRWNESEPRRKK